MRTPLYRLALLITVGALAATTLVFSASAPDSSGPDDTRVALQLQRSNLEAAISRSDATTVAGFFATDARLMIAEFDAIKGRDAIRNAWQFALGSKAVTRLVLTPEEFDGLGGEFPVETGRLVAFDRDGNESAPSHYLLVWKREDGAWKIYRDIASPQSAPAPSADRVGFPRDYRTQLKLLAAPAFNPKLGIVQTSYGNEPAAQAATAATLPYPHGSVLVMEFSEVVKDGAGNPALDADGNAQRGPVLRVDVMRREPGFGEAYGKNRAGEWEFVSYKADGSHFMRPAVTASCAACHLSNAGAANDFVFPLGTPARK